MDIVRLFAIVMLAGSLSGCWGSGVVYESPAAQYIQRSDTITLSAGNAKEANAATHVIDPWPRYVGNRRIRGNGERMAGAIQRYQRPGANRAQGPANPGSIPSNVGVSAPGASGNAVPNANAPL